MQVPDELSGYEAVSEFDLFIQSDTCANDLFYFNSNVADTIKTDISRLFIDVDKPYTALPSDGGGVVKKTTLYGKPVYHEDMFPDEIAIANMLRRYYFPFHDSIKNTINAGAIELILECHTMMAVGPKLSSDPGKPRPLVQLEHMIPLNDTVVNTCEETLACSLLEYFEKSFYKEDGTIAQRYAIKRGASDGFILNSFGKGRIPIIRISISRALFLNDTYFNSDYLRVDELRIQQLKKLIWSAVEKFFIKNFKL